MLTLTPDLNLLHKLCDQLNRALVQAERSYLEFVDACNAAIGSCEAAAQICGRKANEARGNKIATRVVGGAASGIAMGVAAVATGAAVLATGGLGAVVVGAAAGTAGVAGAVTTHHIAKEYAATESSFRSIQRDFDCLLGYAYGLKEGVVHVHTNLEAVSTQVNHIAYCMKNGHAGSVLLVHDTLGRLNVVCTESQESTSKYRKCMNGKINELKKKM